MDNDLVRAIYISSSSRDLTNVNALVSLECYEVKVGSKNYAKISFSTLPKFLPVHEYKLIFCQKWHIHIPGKKKSTFSF